MALPGTKLPPLQNLGDLDRAQSTLDHPFSSTPTHRRALSHATARRRCRRPWPPPRSLGRSTLPCRPRLRPHLPRPPPAIPALDADPPRWPPPALDADPHREAQARPPSRRLASPPNRCVALNAGLPPRRPAAPAAPLDDRRPAVPAVKENRLM